MNTKKPLPSWLPFVIGTFLVLQFAGLGAWQISRGFEKRESRQLFNNETGFSQWRDGMLIRSFQRVRVDGQYDSDHQIILDNIIINSRYGHYVLTPLIIGDDKPVLLVNRGWIEKTAFSNEQIKLAEGPVTIRGRAGSLPKAGYKMGEAFESAVSWPKHGVYPAQVDIEAELGRAVQPFVLLMDHEDQGGFLRHWVPTEFGPGKHFGYALQWFAMGAVLMGLLIWNFRKKRSGG